MLLSSALSGMDKHKEALQDKGGASNPSFISEHTHRLTQYISAVEDSLSEMEFELDIKEAESFNRYIEEGKSANAAKELSKREFIKDRAMIAKTNRLVSSGWKLVSECQSRVKHLIAEATNQI